MHQKSKHVLSGRTLLPAAALLLALAMISFLLPSHAFADEAHTGEARTLIVTVVEEIPADEIDDEDVPLANFDDAGKTVSDQTRHVLLMSGLLLFVLVYAFYFRTYEKRLSSLRLAAAEAETGWRGKRRGQGEEKP